MSTRYIRGPWVFTDTIVVNSTPHVCVNGAVFFVNKTAGGNQAITLPLNPTRGRTLVIVDGKGDANTNAITVTPAAGTINGAANYAMTVNYGSAIICYSGTEWNVIAKI